MLTWREDVEAHALHKRGGRSRPSPGTLTATGKTIRAYINGDRTPGQRRDERPDPLAPFLVYLAARFALTVKDLQERSGASAAVVRRVIGEQVDAGRLALQGADSSHTGPGRAASIHQRT